MKAFTGNRMKLLVTMLAIMLAITLTACGSGGSTGSGGGGSQGGTGTSTSTDSDQQASSGEKTVVTYWGFSEPLPAVLEGFYERYPDIEINFIHVENNDMLQKIQVTLASGGELPDIVHIERGWRGKIISLGVLEELNKEPYNADPSILFDFSTITNSDADGNLVAAPWDLSIGGLMYQRELAKQYFGTDDPDELEAMFPTWEAVLEKGKEALANTNGEVYLFPSLGDLWSIIDAQFQSEATFVDGNKLNKEQLRKAYELLLAFRDAGLMDKLTQDSPAWKAAFADSKHIFWNGPAWAPTYLVETNDPEGEGAGRWGIMAPPGGGTIIGGSSLGIFKDSPNKEAAWKYVEFSRLTLEGMILEKAGGGGRGHVKEAYEDPEYVRWEHPWFGGQDIGHKYFNEIAQSTNDYFLNEFEPVVRQANQTAREAINADPSMTIDEVMERVIEHINEIEPSIITD